ncbi:MAG: hypothetical protein J6P66_07020 [Bacteroidaceae bacterium]|nr:hypothetical protein [Bacteroidaceae bacterium]
MKRIIKSAFSCLITVILLISGTVSVSAQYYMNVVQKDGEKVQYLVSNIDSVYFSGQESPAANYEYVDLGLSVKWATFNVGATKPEEYGDYYAWGEIEPYYDAGYAQEYPQVHWKEGKSAGYDWSSYKWCAGSSRTLTKYCNKSDYGNEGFTDTLTVLAPEDDVAHVKWGGSWRMPTQKEQEELLNNCTWTGTTLNGVDGYRVTGKKEGYTDRSIFLPAANSRNGTNYAGVGGGGEYWSSSLFIDFPYRARFLHFNYIYYGSVRNDYLGVGIHSRDAGRSVRPVCP